jgi:hypothetical protein
MQRPPAGQNLVDQGRQEHQVVQVGAGKAERARVVIRSNSPVPLHSAQAQSLIGGTGTGGGR